MCNNFFSLILEDLIPTHFAKWLVGLSIKQNQKPNGDYCSITSQQGNFYKYSFVNTCDLIS